MQNLGTAAAAMTAAIMIGNMLSVPILRPIALRILAFGIAVGLTAAAFFYFSQSFNPTIGWCAAVVTLVVTLAIVGLAA